MIITKKQREEMEKLVKPIMEFLSKNFDPYASITINLSRAELNEASASVICEDYIQD